MQNQINVCITLEKLKEKDSAPDERQKRALKKRGVRDKKLDM